MSKCQSVKVHHQICRFELLKYIYILNIIYRRIFAPEMSLTLWHLDTFDTFELLEYWYSISCKVNQCIQRAVRPLFWWKNGRADGRKIPLFGVLRIVFGLQLSICGVVDLPILGSNLVKIGVQGAIFDKFWWSLVFCARLADSCTSPPRYVFSGVTLSAACHIAKIMNFGQFGKKNQYF